MLELHVLGGVRLRMPGRDAAPVLAQPRRVALLAYLALSRPAELVTRDSVQGVFWPDRPQAKARKSLNQSLYFLRSHLGADVIVSRGNDLVGVNRERLRCDAVMFEAELEVGRREQALALYGGDLLHGVFVSDGAEFERWVEDERNRLRRLAVRAATGLAEELSGRGQRLEAAHRLREAVSLEPYDETLFGRLLDVLIELGDRTGARRELDTFARRLHEDLDVPVPASLTARLSFADADPPAPVGSGPALPPVPDEESKGPEIVPEPAEDPPTASVGGSPRRPWYRRSVIPALTAALLMLGLLPILWPFLRSEAVTGPLADRRILVMEFANETRVEELDGVGGVAATWIAQELARTGLVDVLPWSMVLRERSSLGETTQPRGPGAGSAVDALATELAIGAGAGFAVSGDYFLRNDSIVIHARILDVAEGIVLRAVESAPVTGDAYLSAIDEVRRRLAGAIAATLDPRLENWSKAAGEPPSFESYRAYAAGLDAFFEERFHRADTLFGRAAELDSTFAAPLVWRIRTRSEGLDATGRAAQAIAELERRALVLPPWEAAMLDYYRSTVLGTQEQRYTHARRLAAIAPNSEWQVMRIEAAFATRRFEEAVRLAENLDYERGWLRDWPYARQLRPSSLHLLGDYEAELASAALLDGHLPGEAVRTRLRALIALGRINEYTTLLERTLTALPWRPKALILGYAAGELNVHDQADLAAALISRAVETVESSRPDPGQEVPHAMMLGRTNRTAGRFDASRRAFTSILPAAAGPGLWEVLTKELALTSAAAGDRDEALRLTAMFEQRNDPRSRGWHSLEMARVYAALGDREEAVRLIRRSRDEGAGYYFWLHASRQLHLLEGYRPFDELMRPRR